MSRADTPDTPVHGWCDPALAGVRAAFEANFAERGEVGAAVCVFLDGEMVVDLQGGWADEARTRPWQPDTLCNFYSVGKAVIGLLLLQLVDDGKLDLDDPVASVWPEFAAGGKEGANVRHALCHRAGVPAIREPLANEDLWDWDRMASALAATAPWWQPGTRHAYHTNTYGFLLGEMVRRLTGDSPGTRLRRVVDDLGAELWYGVPWADQERCAEVIWAGAGPSTVSSPTRPGAAAEASDEKHMIALGYVNPPGFSSMGVVNSPEWRGAQIPSTNGHGTAQGIARLYNALLQPGLLIGPGLLAEATRPQSEGWCPVLGEDTIFGLGFKPTVPHRPFGPNPGSFGHFGTGGAVGFADPVGRVAFGYVMNHVIPRWQSTRNRSLIDAVYHSPALVGP